MPTLGRGLGTLVALAVLAVGGCSSVTLVKPLPANTSASDRAQLEGRWVSGGDVLFVKFTDDGIGKVAGVDWKNGRFELSEAELVVSRANDRGFLSIRSRGTDGWDQEVYLLEYQLTRDGDLVIWEPDPEAFAAVVGQGLIEGTVERGEHTVNVTLTDAPEKVLAFLGDPVNGELFDLRHPTIATRLVIASAETP